MKILLPEPRGIRNALWARALTLIRPLIENKLHFWICSALQKSYLKGQITRETFQSLIDEIRTRLGDHPTLTGWYTNKVNYEVDPDYNPIKLRLIWIDAMIKEFSHEDSGPR